MKSNCGKNIVLCTIICLFCLGNALGQTARKSPGKAFLYSLIAPGLGQKYVSNVGNAKYQIAADVVLFGLTLGYDRYASWLKEDYQALAARHAGVEVSGKGDNYFVEIGKYESIFIYNDRMRVERNFDRVIAETPSNSWQWDSRSNMLKFRNKRIESDEAENRTTFFLSGVFLNHVVSGIHAAWKARTFNAQVPGTNGTTNIKAKFNPFNPKKFFKFTLEF